MMGRIREVLLHPNTLMALFCVALLVGAVASVTASDWNWFRRSGSAAILFAGIASTREIVRKGVKQAYYDRKHIDYGSFVETVAERVKDQEELLDIKARYLGLVGLACGLVVSGFGDLLGLMLGMGEQPK